MGDFRMAAEPQITFGERMIAPVTNISDFIWGGTWDGEAVIHVSHLSARRTSVRMCRNAM